MLARRVTAEGRSRAYLQGRSVSAGDLSAIGTRLLSFYGQHEHRKLTLASAQLDLLDGFCGERQLADRGRATSVSGRAHASCASSCDELRERAGARERDLDLLDFEISRDRAGRARARRRSRQLEAELARLESSRDAAHRGRRGGGRARRGRRRRLGGRGRPDRVRRRRAGARAAASTPSSTRWPSAAPVAAARGARAGGRAAALRRGARKRSRSGWPRSRSGSTCSARLKRKHGGTIEAVLEHAERCRAERERLANLAEESSQARGADRRGRGRAGRARASG